MVFFFVQYKSCGSSSRGILSGGVVLTVDDLYNEKYIRSLFKNRYNLMYQAGVDCLHDVKSMRLEEFEKIFKNPSKINYLLGYSDIESPFRKEVTDKYGPNANKPKLKLTTLYKAGDMFIAQNGVEYIYLGEVENMTMILYNKVQATYKGHLYIQKQLDMGDYDINDFLCMAAFNFEKFRKKFLATKRKALANSDITPTIYKLPQNGVIEKEVFKNYTYRREGKLKITFSMK